MTPAQIVATFIAVDRTRLLKRFSPYPITDQVLANIGNVATAEMRECWDDVVEAWELNDLGEPPDAGTVHVVATYIGNGEVVLGLSLQQIKKITLRRTFGG